MASKLYEIAFHLGAKLQSSYGSAFSSAQKQLFNLNKEAGKTSKGFLGLGNGMGKAVKAAAGLAAGYLSINTLKNVAENAGTASKTMAQMGAVLKSTGGAAGMSQKQLVDLAAAQQKITTYNKVATEQTENMMLTFTNVSSKVFPQAITASEDMAIAMKMNATDAAKTLGKALNDPTAGLSKLTKQGVTFSEAQKKQIKAMQAAGNTAGAQKVILAELNKEFGGSAKAAGDTLPGQITKAKNSLMSAGVTAFSAIMPIVSNLLPSVVGGIQKISDFVQKHQKDIAGIAQKVASLAQGIASGIIPIITGIFGFVMQHGTVVKGVIIGLASAFAIFKVVTLASNAVSEVHNALMLVSALRSGGLEAATLALNGAKGIDATITGSATVAQWGLNAAMLAGLWPILAVVAAIALLAVGAYEVIKHWKQVSGFFKKLWADILNWTITARGNIMKFFSGIWNWIKGFFAKWGIDILVVIAPFIGIPLLIYKNWGKISDFFKKIFSDIWNGIKPFINFIIGGINFIIKGLDSLKVPKITIPGIGSIGGWGINIPLIPRLANGGYIQHRAGGILANIGEGREDEIVSPISKLRNVMNSTSNSNSMNFTYAPQVIIQGNASKNDIIQALSISKAQFKKLIDDYKSGKERLSLNPA